MGFSARLFRRAGVQNGEFEMCPGWVPVVDDARRPRPILLKSTRLTGSITMPVGQQKFETCPDWGANSVDRFFKL
jgi:hypothetical protein